MKIYAKTDVGKVRQNNQDSFCCREFDRNCAYALVCDGMGGHQAGNIASSLATRVIEKELQDARDGFRNRNIEKLLASVIIRANDSVFAASIREESLKGMGTTAVLAMVVDDTLYVAHVGDSRAYGIDRDGKAVKLTKDHSVVQEMIDLGEISEAQANDHPYKHMITRSVGISPDVKVDTATCPRSEFRYVLLCSDGLSNLVSSEEMSDIVTADTENAPQALVDLANSRGGTDNITAVIIDCSDGGNDR